MAEPQKPGPGGLQALELFFLLTGLIGAFLLARGPAANTQQFAFRLSLAVVGLVGTAVLLVLRLVKRKRD
jgi:hypothetical protein